MRTFVTALAICAVSFIADVAGDLAVGAHPALDSAQASARVDLPPYLAGAVRAHPLSVRHVARHHVRHAVAMTARSLKPHATSSKAARAKTPPNFKLPPSKY